MLWTAVLLCVACCQAANASTGTDRHRTLVLIGEEGIRQTHSKYLAAVKALGSELDVRLSSQPKLQLRHWDDLLYETVILLHPEAKEFGGAVDSGALVEFVDAGGNLLLALDTGVSDQVRELAAELGVDVEPAGMAVIDHFSHDPADPSHATVVATNFVDSKAVFGGRSPAPVLYRGIGLSVPPESSLTFPALWASKNAYSGSVSAPAHESSNLAGEQVRLAALSQPRAGSRVAVVGSTWALSDAAFATTTQQGAGTAPAGNEEFATSITRWLLHKRGVLKFGDLRHRHPGGTEQPAAYRIKDDAEFEVHVQELVDGSWQPYRADDVQMEFVMLDPYIRATLQHDSQGNFSTNFKVPDVYGVFKFVIQYSEPGYNHIELSKQIAVQPFKHDEFDRFLVPAYPYYTAAATTMLGFALLTLVFLYSS
jgi:oligosaccharyltransferase complex subunit beta